MAWIYGSLTYQIESSLELILERYQLEELDRILVQMYKWESKLPFSTVKLWVGKFLIIPHHFFKLWERYPLFQAAIVQIWTRVVAAGWIFQYGNLKLEDLGNSLEDGLRMWVVLIRNKLKN